MDKTEFNDFEALISDVIELNGEYIRKFISLGVKYNRSETLEIADEYMDKHDRLIIKYRK